MDDDNYETPSEQVLIIGEGKKKKLKMKKKSTGKKKKKSTGKKKKSSVKKRKRGRPRKKEEEVEEEEERMAQEQKKVRINPIPLHQDEKQLNRYEMGEPRKRGRPRGSTRRGYLGQSFRQGVTAIQQASNKKNIEYLEAQTKKVKQDIANEAKGYPEDKNKGRDTKHATVPASQLHPMAPGKPSYPMDPSTVEANKKLEQLEKDMKSLMSQKTGEEVVDILPPTKKQTDAAKEGNKDEYVSEGIKEGMRQGLINTGNLKQYTKSLLQMANLIVLDPDSPLMKISRSSSVVVDPTTAPTPAPAPTTSSGQATGQTLESIASTPTKSSVRLEEVMTEPGELIPIELQNVPSTPRDAQAAAQGNDPKGKKPLEEDIRTAFLKENPWIKTHPTPKSTIPGQDPPHGLILTSDQVPPPPTLESIAASVPPTTSTGVQLSPPPTTSTGVQLSPPPTTSKEVQLSPPPGAESGTQTNVGNLDIDRAFRESELFRETIPEREKSQRLLEDTMELLRTVMEERSTLSGQEQQAPSPPIPPGGPPSPPTSLLSSRASTPTTPPAPPRTPPRTPPSPPTSPPRTPPRTPPSEQGEYVELVGDFFKRAHHQAIDNARKLERTKMGAIAQQKAAEGIWTTPEQVDAGLKELGYKKRKDTQFSNMSEVREGFIRGMKIRENLPTIVTQGSLGPRPVPVSAGPFTNKPIPKSIQELSTYLEDYLPGEPMTPPKTPTTSRAKTRVSTPQPHLPSTSPPGPPQKPQITPSTEILPPKELAQGLENLEDILFYEGEYQDILRGLEESIAEKEAEKGKQPLPDPDDSDDSDDPGMTGEGSFLAKLLPNSMPKYIAQFVANHADWIVDSITVMRTPINSVLEGVGDALTLGRLKKKMAQRNIDNFFHLFMLITIKKGNQRKKFLYEKNERVNLREVPLNQKPKGEREELPVSLPRKLPLSKFILNGEKAGGRTHYIYHATKANCQKFVTDTLRGNGFMNPTLNKFINQSYNKIIPKWLENGSSFATDLAAIGKKMVGKGECYC
jgi:hypothetical protein